MKRGKDYFSEKLGLDYGTSKTSSLGVQYQGINSYPGTKYDRTINNIFNLDNHPKYQMISLGNNQVKNISHAFNAHYLQQLDTLGKKLSADIDYFTYRQTQDYNFDSHTIFPSTSKKSIFNNSIQQIDNYSAKVDINYPVQWAKLSYGAKASFIETNNKVNYFDKTSGIPVLDPLQSNKFNYKENIQAVYADIAKSLGKKWQAKLGLRVEHTQTKGIPKKGDPFKRHYTKFFPMAYVLYQVSKNHSMNLNYSRRIKRPAFWELNPARFYIDATSYSEGNPFQQPSFTDNIELTHTYKNKLISTLYLSVTSDGFGQIPIVSPKDNIRVYTRKNYYTRYSYVWQESYTVSPFPWWQSQNQMYLYYSKTRLDKDIDFNAPVQNGTAFYLSTNNTFTLNRRKTLKAEINFWYSSPRRILIHQLSEVYSLDLGVKVALLKDKLQGSLRVNDILYSSINHFTLFTSGIQQEYSPSYDPRYVRIGLTYRFGNNKIKVKEHQGGNQEERRRAN